jgi:hypothetical protein
MEPKPLASLSSMLLARKGAARPAMRRPMAVNSVGTVALAQDDLGWNDMGYDVDPDPSTPMDYDHESMFNPLANAVPEVKPEVKLQQERIAEQLNVQAEALHEKIDAVAKAAPIIRSVPKLVKPTPRAAAGLKAKSAFTLRLDSERHLKLRLACVLSHRSAQQLVTAALDQFLEAIPEVNQLASQLPTKNQCQSV